MLVLSNMFTSSPSNNTPAMKQTYCRPTVTETKNQTVKELKEQYDKRLT